MYINSSFIANQNGEFAILGTETLWFDIELSATRTNKIDSLDIELLNPPPSSYSSAVPSKTNACESFHTTWRQENSPRLTCKNALGHNSWNLRCKTATFVSGTFHRISRKIKQQNGYHLISYHDVSNIHQAINTWHKINSKYSTTTQPINSNKNGAACTVELKLPPTPARRRRHPRDLGPRHKKCL